MGQSFWSIRWTPPAAGQWAKWPSGQELLLWGTFLQLLRRLRPTLHWAWWSRYVRSIYCRSVSLPLNTCIIQRRRTDWEWYTIFKETGTTAMYKTLLPRIIHILFLLLLCDVLWIIIKIFLGCWNSTADKTCKRINADFFVSTLLLA